jgi:mono/diheme cytochrome c family protein
MSFFTRRREALFKFILIALLLPVEASARPSPSAEDRNRVTRQAASWAAELAALCPVAQPEDTAALEACRGRIYRSTVLRKAVSPHIVWGRQADASKSLKEQNLTQLSPDVWLGLYAPLFMFNGKHTVEYVASEGLFLIRLQVAFRNRLPPGQFPYPFWHDHKKWSAYQGARTLLVWVDPGSAMIRGAQYTPLGKHPPLIHSQVVGAGRFDGRWMWTDASGRLQPSATLFDGLYSPKNPYKAKLEVAYRDLALKLRAGQCSSCHVPNNPASQKRLVLLQTPAHAAGEIERVVESVRSNRMPLDELGLPKQLSPRVRRELLESGTKFAALVDAARQWEARNKRSP